MSGWGVLSGAGVLRARVAVFCHGRPLSSVRVAEDDCSARAGIRRVSEGLATFGGLRVSLSILLIGILRRLSRSGRTEMVERKWSYGMVEQEWLYGRCRSVVVRQEWSKRKTVDFK